MVDGSLITNPSRPPVRRTTEGPADRGGTGSAAAAGAGLAGSSLAFTAVAHPERSASPVANSRHPAIVVRRKQLLCSLPLSASYLRAFSIVFPLGTLCGLFQG